MGFFAQDIQHGYYKVARKQAGKLHFKDQIVANININIIIMFIKIMMKSYGISNSKCNYIDFENLSPSLQLCEKGLEVCTVYNVIVYFYYLPCYEQNLNLLF